MNPIDIVLWIWGLFIWIGSFLSGRDSLYKLFLGLIIWFLSYLVIFYQIQLSDLLKNSELSQYQKFLWEHKNGVLNILLISIPALWVFFMLHPRIIIETRRKSPSHLLLGCILPFFMMGILAQLETASLLSSHAFWQQVFQYLHKSYIYKLFYDIPWLIFYLLAFLIFYKSIFLLFVAFFTWLYQVFQLYFINWRNKQNPEEQRDIELDEFIEE